MEIQFKEVDVMKLNVANGDILLFKIYSDDLGEEELDSLKLAFQKRFPQQQILLLCLGVNDRIDLDILKSSESEVKADCSDPVSYCNECGCGKKERIESGKE